MSQVDAHGRPEPPHAAGETETLLGFLDHQRATLAWKCADLDDDGLRATTGASSISLGGLLKHLALNEVGWFVADLHDRELGDPWSSVPDADTWAWDTTDDSVDDLWGWWRVSVELARAAIREALDETGLDGLVARRRPDGFQPSLRWVLIHMIEEYARHNGHADLVREAVDGPVGE